MGPRTPVGPSRRRDDRGGVWIVTGIVLGAMLYAGIVLMDVAGFTEVLPLVVIPPVLLGLIGANNLLGGGRDHGAAAAAPPVDRGRAPSSSSGPNGSRLGTSSAPGGVPPTEEPPGPA
jgi:hypothetical protein